MGEALDLSVFVKHEGAIAHAEFAIDGVGCAGCIQKIENGLKRVPGVVDARLNFTNRRLSVDWHDAEVGASDLVYAIEAMGYTAHPFEPHRVETEEAAEARR